MPPVVSRILMTVFMLPLAVLIYCVVLVLSYRWAPRLYMPSPVQWLAGGFAAWLTVAVIHYFTWRMQVTWSRRRITRTLLSAAGSILVAAATAAALFAYSSNGDFSFFLVSALAPVLWLMSTAFIWRDTPAEYVARQKHRRDSIVCPVCKYNLTGLTEARCPECGTAFTLDHLFAAQCEGADVESGR